MSPIYRLKEFLNKAAFRRRTHANIQTPFFIESPENICFEGDCYVGPHSYWSAKGGIHIGDNVIFGPHSVVWTYNHDFRSNEFIPYGGPDILKPVRIDKNVWIGLGATLMPGVHIGEGAIIAAKSVITKDVPPMAVMAGNPAIVKGWRDKEVYDQLKNEQKIYLRKKKHETQKNSSLRILRLFKFWR